MLVLKIAVLWLAVDIFIFATYWYFVATVKPRWPDWWRRVVADELPQYGQLSAASQNSQPTQILIIDDDPLWQADRP